MVNKAGFVKERVIKGECNKSRAGTGGLSERNNRT